MLQPSKSLLDQILGVCVLLQSLFRTGWKVSRRDQTKKAEIPNPKTNNICKHPTTEVLADFSTLHFVKISITITEYYKQVRELFSASKLSSARLSSNLLPLFCITRSKCFGILKHFDLIFPNLANEKV